VRAEKAFAPGETVLSIPLCALITIDLARASAAGARFAAAGLDEAWTHSLLAIYLLHERRRPRSPWRAYLDALPASFPRVPLFHPGEAQALLEGSLALRMLAERRASLRSDFQAIARRAPDLARFPYADFVWARTAVISRVFGLTIEGRDVDALVPLADMMNHRRPPDARWSYDGGAFVMTAAGALRRGEAIHDSYGRKSNARLLVNYGFTVDDNDEEDEASVLLAIPPDAPLADEKTRLLGVPPGVTQPFRLSARAQGEAAGALSFLRIACATLRELEEIQGAPLDVHRVPPLNGRNESAALALLAGACDRALAAFPTTVEEDDAILGGGALPVDTRSAVVARRAEKRVLLRWREIARTALPLLRLPHSTLSAALDAGAAGEGPARRYLDDYVAPAAPGPRA
jgi:histone-lysine N-methyltransferase SETD3